LRGRVDLQSLPTALEEIGLGTGYRVCKVELPERIPCDSIRETPLATFSDILDAADNLSLDEQQALVDILRCRIAEHARNQAHRDIDHDERGKLTTGVTVPQWSSILMLRNLKSPETYFQAAFRVQSPWSIKNPNGDDASDEEILKPICFVFDFAPTRALRQLSEYGIGLSPNEPNPENAVRDLVSFLPVLAYDGANMTQIDAGGILDIAMAGTSATLLARKWESALLVNVDNDTLRRVLNDPEAMAAVERIEGWRSLGDNIIETIINKSEKVKELKKKGKDGYLTPKEKKELSDEEKEYKSKRKLVQEKLIKFATRIPAFMYLTDFRENTLADVITKLEPDLFLAVTGLTVNDFHMLVRLKVFNTEQMNQAVFAFRRYEDTSLRYTGIESHEGLTHYGIYDTVVAKE
jgi:hypothetical protein